MSSELIAIVAAAVALAGLNLVTTERLDGRIIEVEDRLGARITRLDGRVTVVEERLAEVQKETARLSGLLEGLELADRLPPDS